VERHLSTDTLLQNYTAVLEIILRLRQARCAAAPAPLGPGCLRLSNLQLSAGTHEPDAGLLVVHSVVHSCIGEACKHRASAL
jgi:hypothetical protein